jgi:hypothetical protein
MAQSATGDGGGVEVWVSGDGGDWSCGPSTHYRIATPVFDHGMMVGRLNTREDLAEAAEQSCGPSCRQGRPNRGKTQELQ